MKTVGVFVKPTENLSEPLEHLVSVLRRAGCKVLLEAVSYTHLTLPTIA